jgi:hypothetical protein
MMGFPKMIESSLHMKDLLALNYQATFDLMKSTLTNTKNTEKCSQQLSAIVSSLLASIKAKTSI